MPQSCNVNLNKRAVILVGAGASVEYGLPATDNLSDIINQEVKDTFEGMINDSDDLFKNVYGENPLRVYNSIRENLISYYGDKKEAHFERLYHAISENLQLIPCESSALPQFRPIIQAFVDRKDCYKRQTLWMCSKEIIKTIYEQVALACDNSENNLKPLENFLSELSSRFVSRVYTTNYDNFFEQATNFKWTSGFDSSQSISYFEPSKCWSSWDDNCIFHLHGSIHFGYPKTYDVERSMEFVNYSSLKEAYNSISQTSVSDTCNQKGAHFERSPIITGLDKVDKIQQSPFSHYYACLARDLMQADIIFILGCGLADLHINNWIIEARKNNKNTKIIFVDYIKESEFQAFIRPKENPKSNILANDFKCEFVFNERNYSGWTINSKKDLVIWSAGFKSFLENGAEILDIIAN